MQYQALPVLGEQCQEEIDIPGDCNLLTSKQEEKNQMLLVSFSDNFAQITLRQSVILHCIYGIWALGDLIASYLLWHETSIGASER